MYIEYEVQSFYKDASSEIIRYGRNRRTNLSLALPILFIDSSCHAFDETENQETEESTAED